MLGVSSLGASSVRFGELPNRASRVCQGDRRGACVGLRNTHGCCYAAIHDAGPAPRPRCWAAWLCSPCNNLLRCATERESAGLTAAGHRVQERSACKTAVQDRRRQHTGSSCWSTSPCLCHASQATCRPSNFGAAEARQKAQANFHADHGRAQGVLGFAGERRAVPLRGRKAAALGPTLPQVRRRERQLERQLGPVPLRGRKAAALGRKLPQVRRGARQRPAVPLRGGKAALLGRKVPQVCRRERKRGPVPLRGGKGALLGRTHCGVG
jgi:hypothetical protein